MAAIINVSLTCMEKNLYRSFFPRKRALNYCEMFDLAYFMVRGCPGLMLLEK